MAIIVSSKSMRFLGVFFCVCLGLMFENVASSSDYATALTKSLLFFEGQRSGKLPANQRVQWRGDSALKDGQDNNIDLTGGYYDAGDNLKLGFPFAFTITTLSWSTIEMRDKLSSNKELDNALAAIKWGTDYLIKAHPQPDVLYGEVGIPNDDHQCWQRPEDMTTLRTSYRIDDDHPGSDLAAETAAAFAAASIAFQPVDKSYASQLQTHAVHLFDFAVAKPGLYQNSINPAGAVYASSGFEDELIWAAAWLYEATGLKKYMDFLSSNQPGGVPPAFSWDNKYVGAQILVAKMVLDGKVGGDGIWAQYKEQGEKFICSCVQKAGGSNFKLTPGGLLYFMEWDNMQYVASSTLTISIYSQYLASHKASLQCDGGTLSPSDLTAFVKSQVDYILGENPQKMSYMVGYGSNFPQKIHHRGSSIVSIKKDPTPVTCQGGFAQWFNKDIPNPNVLDGAIVSTDDNDNYEDSRQDFQHAEPTIVTNGPLVGVLAFLA